MQNDSVPSSTRNNCKYFSQEQSFNIVVMNIVDVAGLQEPKTSGMVVVSPRRDETLISHGRSSAVGRPHLRKPIPMSFFLTDVLSVPTHLHIARFSVDLRKAVIQLSEDPGVCVSARSDPR